MLKKFVFKNPFQLFLTILLPFLISTLTILFVQSSFLYRNFEKYALEMVYHEQKTNLLSTGRNITAMAQTAKSLSVTAFFDKTISDLLYTDVKPEDYSKYLTKLQSYKNIYPFLQSIYIYNGHSVYASPSLNFVYNRSSFADKEIFGIMDDMEHYHSHSIVLRKIPNVLGGITTNANKSVNVYSYLFFDSQIQSGKVSEAIILNISEEWVKQTIGSPVGQNKNRVFIVDHDGKLLSDDGAHPLLTDLKDTDFIKQINASKEPTGSFRADINGTDSFVTYAATDAFSWKLISITPYQTIVENITKMKYTTYLLVFFFIVASMLLTFYFSRRLYIPVKLVIQNYKVLESEKRNDFYYRKQDFLRKMVHSGDLLSAEAVQASFRKFNIALDPTALSLLVLFRIDQFSDFSTKFKLADRSLLKYGIDNIISELFDHAYKYECIDIYEDQILVLLSYDSAEAPSQDAQLIALVKEVQEKTYEFLKISLTATFSDTFETWGDLQSYYLNTLDLSYYRLILGHRSLIFGDCLQARTDEFKYQDKELTEALIQGRIDEAKEALSDIIRKASQYSLTTLNSVLIRLLLSIRSAVELLEANHAITVRFNINIYLSKLSKIETLENILADFYHLFDDLVLQLESKKENKYSDLFDNVMQIIRMEFANPSLTLDTIAQKVNLSPNYLAKLFKKHHLISMNDYINDVRLQCASDLIITTDETIMAIMEKSGFSTRSHFFTLFKKAYGVSPNQYRSQSRLLKNR